MTAAHTSKPPWLNVRSVTKQMQWHRLCPGFAIPENAYPGALQRSFAGCQPWHKPVPLYLAAVAAQAEGRQGQAKAALHFGQKSVVGWGFRAQTVGKQSHPGSLAGCLYQCGWNNHHRWLEGELGSDQLPLPPLPLICLPLLSFLLAEGQQGLLKGPSLTGVTGERTARVVRDAAGAAL